MGADSQMTHLHQENFRMSNATFLYLCNELRSPIEKSDTIMRKAIPVEQRVALTLWFLSTTIGRLGISLVCQSQQYVS